MTKELCEGCKEYYTKRAKNQKTCSFQCKKKLEIEESNKKWLVREARRRVDPGTNDKIERARVSKQLSNPFLRKFSACRG